MSNPGNVIISSSNQPTNSSSLGKLKNGCVGGCGCMLLLIGLLGGLGGILSIVTEGNKEDDIAGFVGCGIFIIGGIIALSYYGFRREKREQPSTAQQPNMPPVQVPFPPAQNNSSFGGFKSPLGTAVPPVSSQPVPQQPIFQQPAPPRPVVIPKIEESEESKPKSYTWVWILLAAVLVFAAVILVISHTSSLERQREQEQQTDEQQDDTLMKARENLKSSTDIWRDWEELKQIK